MPRNDQIGGNMNKKAPQSIDILVKSLDLARFGRKFPEFLQVAEYFSPRVFRAGRNQNILGVCESSFEAGKRIRPVATKCKKNSTFFVWETEGIQRHF